MRSVQIAPYGHYNAIALYNQTINFNSYRIGFLLMISIAGFGMNVA